MVYTHPNSDILPRDPRRRRFHPTDSIVTTSHPVLAVIQFNLLGPRIVVYFCLHSLRSPALSLLFSFRALRNRDQYRILPETVYRDNSIFYRSFFFHLPYFLCFSLFLFLLWITLLMFDIPVLIIKQRKCDVTCPNRNSRALFK